MGPGVYPKTLGLPNLGLASWIVNAGVVMDQPSPNMPHQRMQLEPNMDPPRNWFLGLQAMAIPAPGSAQASTSTAQRLKGIEVGLAGSRNDDTWAGTSNEVTGLVRPPNVIMKQLGR